MPVVCIAGMHRSGTSMIARLLNLCGLYLGEEQDLLPAQPDNPEGFWENRKFVEINDAILTSLGGSWDAPPEPDSILSQKRLIRSLEKHAQNLIGDFAGMTFWGWKDPRNSLTFPFWQNLIPGLKVIVCLRNPIEVAKSLAQRNHFSETVGLSLWQSYNQSLMTSIAPTHRLITHYDMFFADPKAELRRVLEFINIEASDSTIRSACRATLSSLKHNHAEFRNLIEVGTPLDIVNLYMEMCSQSGQAYIDAIKTEGSSLLENSVSVELFSKFIQNDPLVLSMYNWLSEKQRRVELLTEQVAKKKSENEHNVQVLQSLTAQLETISNSKAWKFVMFLRRIRGKLFPPNS